MRTNIEIDDDLMAEAMAAGGFATKRDTVEAALRMLAQRHKAYSAALALGGKIDWQGDLDGWRRDKAWPTSDDAAAKHRVAEPLKEYKVSRTAAKADGKAASKKGRSRR